MAISLGEAQLVANFVQAIVYGIYLVTAGHCAYALLAGGNGAKKRYYLIAVAAAMLVIVTLNIAVCFRYILDTFIFSAAPVGPDGGFSSTAKELQALDVVQVSVVIVSSILFVILNVAPRWSLQDS